jgi:hypothetical protein
MKHSAIEDNWRRVELLNSLACDLNEVMQRKDKAHDSHGNLSFLKLHLSGDREKERHLIGMIVTWSAITLECLINHAISDVIDNRIAAITSIEYPKKMVDHFKGKPELKSELSQKLYILSEGHASHDSLSEATYISSARNSIVHDKPIEYYDIGEGDYEIEEYSLRTHDFKIPEYEKIGDFYTKCESVKNEIIKHSKGRLSVPIDFNFNDLK